MKHILLLILILPFASLLEASPVSLVEKGRPLAKIYLPPPAPPAVESKKKKVPEPEAPLESALKDLNYHLEKMTGVPLEVVRTDSVADIKAPAIVLGELAKKSGLELSATPQQDSLRLLTKDGKLLIAGETDKGTLNGIYALLTRLGCEWVMPGTVGEVIPKTPTLAVPDLDVKEIPSFYVRSLHYRGGKKLNSEQDLAEFDLWTQRQRMEGIGPRERFGWGHYWGVFIKKHKKEFDEDPTMLALVRDADGNLARKGPQIESTHPRVIELFVQDIKEEFEKNKWPKDKTVAFSIGPADGAGFSESTESTLAGSGRVDPMLGVLDSTDVIVLLGNQILERIEKEYPNVTLGFYSYSTHEDYPEKYKPNPKLNIIFAPIGFSRLHGPLDENSKTWPYYRKVLERWGSLAREQGNILIYRGYNWNLAENMMPFSKLRVVGEELPWYRENGVIGVNIEATKAWAVNGPHDFLLAKLMWDVRQDWKKVVHYYCEKSFGKGAGAMEKYLLGLTDRQHAAGFEAGSFHSFPLIYDQAFVDAGKVLIKEAVAKAEFPEEKTRAGYFLYPLEEMEMYLKFHRAVGEFDFAAAAELYRQMNEHWQNAYAQNSCIVAKEVPQYLKRYLDKFVSESTKYSSAPYSIVYRVPDEMATMLDPNNVGEQLNFQGPINDTFFFKTRTWSLTWDAQGLSAYRRGAVWYRVAFDLPADLKAQPLGLFIGSAEDEASVWLNGKFIGQGRGFSVPFVFDLTDAAKPGQKNQLAIKVARNSAINEIGLGGLFRPSFVFAGPRVQQVAPEAPKDRILPGGEAEPAQ